MTLFLGFVGQLCAGLLDLRSRMTERNLITTILATVFAAALAFCLHLFMVEYYPRTGFDLCALAELFATATLLWQAALWREGQGMD